MFGRRKNKDLPKGGFGKKMTSREWKQATIRRNQSAILNENTAFVIKEAYKIARTNIIFSVAGSGESECKVIAITSASPGEGKTTTCLNLAITFAQTGAKTLIIDADLRKPRIHQYLGVVKTNGLSTVLSNQKSFDSVVFRNIRGGLDCLASGSIPPNPAELLASDAMVNLIKELKKEYEYIFIDTPPVTIVTDAVALSSNLHGVVVVVREGMTSHENIENAITLMKIAKAKILGFFVNDIDPSATSYGAAYQSSYGRRYSYHYGYKYAYKYAYKNRSHSSYNYSDKPEMPAIDPAELKAAEPSQSADDSNSEKE